MRQWQKPFWTPLRPLEDCGTRYNPSMRAQVVQAIHDAFHPSKVDDENLKEVDGRVFGSAKVIESPVFDGLDDARRQRLFWEHLIKSLGSESTNVGPVILEPTSRG